MHYEDVETFLNVCRYRGISKAAEAMYLAQSTVSQRIQRLERDLQCSLMIRKSGVRAFALTPLGMRFFATAEKLTSAWDEAAGFAHSGEATVYRLSVGSIASVYETLLPPLIRSLYRARVGMQIRTVVSTSPELCNMVEAGAVDFAFTAMEIRSPTLLCVPVFRENYACVCSASLLPEGKKVSISDMDRYHELFYSWESKFKRWHDSARSPKSASYLHCDTPSVWLHIARSMDFWTICPDSAILYLRSHGLRFDVHELSEPLPRRETYLIRQAAGSVTSSETEIFEKEFAAFCRTLPKELHASNERRAETRRFITDDIIVPRVTDSKERAVQDGNF